ncbi:MAG: 5'-3' exonuclease H3TH domain-containing protein, partial [Acidobacteriota bacterium]
MNKQRLFLIDGMSLFYRSFYGIRHLSTSKGQPTNAIYGLTMTLRRLINEDKPDYLAFCLDTPEPTFRHDAYESYKGNRDLMPNDLVSQLPYLEKICAALRVPLVKLPGYEADDVIGTLALEGARRGLQVMIVSNDKDMCQLVNDDICIMKWDKTRYIICDAEGVKSWLGVLPGQVIELLGLMGDSSDNVPGAPGIGEKGALQIIQQFGSIEAALTRWSEVTRKTYRESLRDHAEQIKLSRQLVTIDTAIPIKLELESLRCNTPDYRAAYTLFSELEFDVLVREYAAQANSMKVEQGNTAVATQATLATAITLDYRAITNDTEFRKLIDQIWASDRFTFAVTAMEGNGSLPIISISFAPGNVIKIDLNTLGLEPAKVLEALSDIWTNGFIGKATYDSKRALTLLNNALRELHRCAGLAAPTPFHFENLQEDVLLAAYLINPEQPRYGLTELAREYLNIEPDETAHIDPADLTERLVPVLRTRLVDDGLENVYLDMELPLVEILYDMEQVGVAIDTNALAELSRQFEEMLSKLTSEIYSLAGQEFNINSTIQLGELFEKLNFE